MENASKRTINQFTDEFGISFMSETVMNDLAVAMAVENGSRGLDWNNYGSSLEIELTVVKGSRSKIGNSRVSWLVTPRATTHP